MTFLVYHLISIHTWRNQSISKEINQYLKKIVQEVGGKHYISHHHRRPQSVLIWNQIIPTLILIRDLFVHILRRHVTGEPNSSSAQKWLKLTSFGYSLYTNYIPFESLNIQDNTHMIVAAMTNSHTFTSIGKSEIDSWS